MRDPVKDLRYAKYPFDLMVTSDECAGDGMLTAHGGPFGIEPTGPNAGSSRSSGKANKRISCVRSSWMLAILLVVHLLSSKAKPAQVLGLDPRAPNNSESCDDINNCRRLFDIVWGCLTTIFACTWVSAHPNVPPPRPTRPDAFWPTLKWKLVVALLSIWRRLKLMLIAVIAPELVAVPEEAIEDKSKGDVLSKGVALLQGVWFVAQYVAQRLPATELEVATLAFAVLNAFIWVLWWGKPLDVREPIVIGPGGDSEVFGPKALTRRRWTDSFRALLNGMYTNYHPLLSSSVPAFWSVASDRYHDHNCNHNVTHHNHVYFIIPAITVLCVGSVFGAIHCMAWNASFPSVHEMWMWRSSAVVVTATPQLLLPVLIIAPRTGHTNVPITAAWLATPFYVIARLFLIIIPFVTLRALPPGVLVDVDWSVYFPHI
ncbi:hypothetical protein GGX14DRAFT_396942 [Mycena pura]|uniref:Uncharacterized protein n=1 Tax=Mycena pura TaxID=153505 RepID=A0AAD6VDC1_9AGAR|nr:hypothetical protein GGX14DRAFT_396942 [Mycena pura]